MIALAIQNATLAVVALLTGVALVAIALWLAGLISPRSFNPQKGEAYECGIPTRGESIAHFELGHGFATRGDTALVSLAFLRVK